LEKEMSLEMIVINENEVYTKDEAAKLFGHDIKFVGQVGFDGIKYWTKGIKNSHKMILVRQNTNNCSPCPRGVLPPPPTR
jgi:hypothetical protein